MNHLLLAGNLILAALIGTCAFYWTKHPAHFDESKYSIKETAEKDVKSSVNLDAKMDAKLQNMGSMPKDEMLVVMTSKEIFHPDRLITSGNKSALSIAKSKINAQMSLIGTYAVGDSLGAIIVQKLQGNAAQLLKQLQAEEYEAYQLSTRRTITSLKEEKEGDAKAADAKATDAKAAEVKVADAKAAETKDKPEEKQAIVASNVFRQYLKVGDETINGFTLTEVSRTSAKLQRNKEVIQLTLLSPTESRNAQNKQPQQNNNNKNQQNNNNKNQQNNNKNQQNNNKKK